MIRIIKLLRSLFSSFNVNPPWLHIRDPMIPDHLCAFALFRSIIVFIIALFFFCVIKFFLAEVVIIFGDSMIPVWRGIAGHILSMPLLSVGRMHDLFRWIIVFVIWFLLRWYYLSLLVHITELLFGYHVLLHEFGLNLLLLFDLMLLNNAFLKLHPIHLLL